MVLTWPPGKNDKSGSNFALGISGGGLALEVLALGGSNLPSGSVWLRVQGLGMGLWHRVKHLGLGLKSRARVYDLKQI